MPCPVCAVWDRGLLGRGWGGPVTQLHSNFTAHGQCQSKGFIGGLRIPDPQKWRWGNTYSGTAGQHGHPSPDSRGGGSPLPAQCRCSPSEHLAGVHEVEGVECSLDGAQGVQALLAQLLPQQSPLAQPHAVLPGAGAPCCQRPPVGQGETGGGDVCPSSLGPPRAP